jgi:hypothetical protein
MAVAYTGAHGTSSNRGLDGFPTAAEVLPEVLVELRRAFLPPSGWEPSRRDHPRALASLERKNLASRDPIYPQAGRCYEIP